MLSSPVYLGASTRTPIGKFGGSLARWNAPALGALALKEALRRAGFGPRGEVARVPAPSGGPKARLGTAAHPDFVIVGHARQAGNGPNSARQIAISAGLPETVPAMTVNQACASGMVAIFSGIEKILLGRANSVWSGGVESMSQTPYYLMQARFGQRLGHGEATDGMHRDGFFCPMSQMVMGETVDRFIAQELGITRRDQDEYALLSQQRAAQAWENGAFTSETFPIIDSTSAKTVLADDEHRRPNTTLDQLIKLPPVFDRDRGTVTAGNSSGITDGAAFLHLSAEKLASSEAEVLDYETIALDPKRMGLGPIAAVEAILKRQKLDWASIDAIEINEAFAAQVIACERALKVPREKLNRRGGAIAIGHPIGATGARIVVTLIHLLRDKPGALGIAALCVSGGMGAALLLRRL